MRRMLGVTAIVVGALLLVGCTSTSGAQSGGAPAYSGGSAALPSAFDSAADMASGESSQNSTSIVDRQVVTTGSVSLTVDEPVEGANSAIAIVERAGGHVDERTEHPATDTEKASAHLVLRIPSASLTDTLTALKKLGTVNNASISASDVTTQVQDLKARITALQTSVDRLLDLMSKSSNTTDLIAIETALSERQANLESLQAQSAYLGDQVSLSTVTLDLVSEGTVASAAPHDFWAGLVAGWDALVVAGGGALIGLGVALPWLVLLGLIGGAIYLIVRATARRKQVPTSTDA